MVMSKNGHEYLALALKIFHIGASSDNFAHAAPRCYHSLAQRWESLRMGSIVAGVYAGATSSRVISLHAGTRTLYALPLLPRRTSFRALHRLISTSLPSLSRRGTRAHATPCASASFVPALLPHLTPTTHLHSFALLSCRAYSGPGIALGLK